jgi:hypothetical protein
VPEVNAGSKRETIFWVLLVGAPLLILMPRVERRELGPESVTRAGDFATRFGF